MRRAALLIALALTLPLAGALGPLQAPAAVEPLPMDLSDGDLLELLAQDKGLHPMRSPTIAVPTDLGVEDAVMRLAERAGTPMSPEDAAIFTELDPLVAAPVLTLLVAVDQAWTLRDEAMADLSPAEVRELTELLGAGETTSPRAQALASQVNDTQMVESAILLLDTLEQVVVPQLREAARAGAWPPVPVADPVGILRLGSTGDDVEAVNRLIQIDPQGDDVYHNNAGATNVLTYLDPLTPIYPIALSIDLEGNDRYDIRLNPDGRYAYITQASGVIGVGILLDFTGDDHYSPCGHCQGGGMVGVGYLRDHTGNDTRKSGNLNMGVGVAGVGVLRDDSGDDYYNTGRGGGYAYGIYSTGLLWDRGGTDRYEIMISSHTSYGYADYGGRGWFVDEGPEQDYYETATINAKPHGCNDCTWTAGLGTSPSPFESEPGGRGNDNAGGLAYLLTEQWNPCAGWTACEVLLDHTTG